MTHYAQIKRLDAFFIDSKNRSYALVLNLQVNNDLQLLSKLEIKITKDLTPNLKMMEI